ncbi:hypothetical protein FS749_006813 [Ceratobasidium sp. UAMH 11750]|nr:hypothetical protein FS749_006813 [Ceratobasidium sp. UAMH 11750]
MIPHRNLDLSRRPRTSTADPEPVLSSTSIDRRREGSSDPGSPTLYPTHAEPWRSLEASLLFRHPSCGRHHHRSRRVVTTDPLQDREQLAGTGNVGVAQSPRSPQG